MFVPWAVYVWLLLSSAAVTYDTLYIQLRPETFRYHQYEWKFEPYQVYQFFDTLKINMDDRFLLIQSYLNVAEVALLLLALLLSLLPQRRTKFIAALLILVGQAMVFWKTIMYLCYDRPFVTVSVRKLYSIAVVFYYFTIAPFLICPLLTIRAITKRFTQAILPEPTQKGKTE